MKLIIDIPDSAYKVCYDLRNVGDTNCLADILVNAVGIGTPIPDNATVCDIEQIRAEIEEYKSTIDNAISEDELKIEGMQEAYNDCLEVIDKYTK